MIAAAVTIISYCLWAFERATHFDAGRSHADSIFFELSILPFVLGVLSVELAIATGDAGAPEELVLRNRVIQVLGIGWLSLIAIGIYT
jgi:decaprenyl-phosphate phosphoribosyltransferase